LCLTKAVDRKNKSKPTPQQNSASSKGTPSVVAETKSAKLSQAKESDSEKDLKIAETKSAKGSKETKEGKVSSKIHDLDKGEESDGCEEKDDSAADDVAASKSDSDGRAAEGETGSVSFAEVKSPNKVERETSGSESEGLQESVLVRADSSGGEQEGEGKLTENESEGEGAGEEEGYVEVSHLDFSPDPLPETEVQRGSSPEVAPVTVLEANQDDDAILE
jgi:hypothetical protein